MKMSLKGFKSNHIVQAKHALENLSLFKAHKPLDDEELEQIESALESSVSDFLALYDVIFALLRGDVTKRTLIKFFALSREDLRNHNHTNDLIIFDNDEAEQ